MLSAHRGLLLAAAESVLREVWGYLEAEDLVRLRMARRAELPGLEFSGRALALRGLFASAEQISRTAHVFLERWPWVVLGRRRLAFTKKSLDATGPVSRAEPSGLVWADVFVGSTPVLSAVLTRVASTEPRVITDPDGVLEDVVVEDDEILATRVEEAIECSRLAGAVVVQVKAIASPSSPPLVLYEWRCGKKAQDEAPEAPEIGEASLSFFRAREHGIDHPAPLARLAEFQAVLMLDRRAATLRVRLMLGLTVPTKLWPSFGWPSVDLAIRRPGDAVARRLEDQLWTTLGDARAKFTARGSKMLRAPLRRVWEVASAADTEVMCLLETPAPPTLTIPLDATPDFLKCLPKDRRPARLCVVVGSAGAASAKHADPYAWRGWHLLLRGVKRWHFGPPAIDGGDDEGVARVPAATTGRGKVDIAASFVHRDRDDRGLDELVLQRAGDLLIFPGGRWHRVTHVQGPTLAVCGQYAPSPRPVLAHVARYRKLVAVQAAFDDLALPPWLQIHLLLKLATRQPQDDHASSSSSS